MTVDSLDEPQNTLLPLDMRGLTDELRAKAKRELFESEEKKANGIRLLRTWLDDEKDLTYPNDDAFLLQFLRARKFDVKKAFSLLKNFFHVRRKYGELYNDFDFSTVQKAMDTNCLGFLPYRDPEGSLILIIHAGRWNPMEVTMAEVMRTLTSGLIQAVTSPATQIAGFKVIVDFKGFGIKHLTNIPPTYLWLFAEALQNCFPGRFRAVHVVNETPLWSYIWAILKQVLTKKLRERFQFHGKNMSKLHKYIPPSVLPEEYEGEIGPFDNSVWAQKMQQYEKYIAEMYTYGYRKKN